MTDNMTEYDGCVLGDDCGNLATAREVEGLRAALRGWIEAKDALEQFERDNPNDSTKNWERLLNAVGDAEDAARAALAGKGG